jgi:hypothetical protein
LGVNSVVAIYNATLIQNIIQCSIGMAGMFRPLSTQDTDTEESGVMGGGGGGIMLPKQRENRCRKKRLFTHLPNGLRGI